MRITIDGSVCVGKTSLCMALEREGFFIVRMGPAFRSIGLWARDCEARDGQPDYEAVLSRIGLPPHSWDNSLRTKPAAADRLMPLEHPDTDTERGGEAGAHAGADPRVIALVSRLAAHRASVSPNAVVEGRDTGIVILPDADLHFVLTADDLVRASRMASRSGLGIDEAAAIVRRRDDLVPVRMPSDPVIIDTSSLTQEAVLNVVLSHILRRSAEPVPAIDDGPVDDGPIDSGPIDDGPAPGLLEGII